MTLPLELVADDATRRNFETIERLLGGLAGVALFIDTGSPNGAVTASPPALYLNLSGGAGTTLYVKESGTGDTGWTGK